MRYRIAAAVAGLLLVSSGLALAAGPYLQPFDGAPSAPQPYPSIPGLAAWDVTVHSRDNPTWTQLDAMEASHGADCSGPPATHHLSGNYADSVFQCNNHIMTAISAGGYGVIYLTPPVLADWTDGPATIQFDMSTARTSLRDWTDVWLSSFDGHLQLPLEEFLPDLQGPPRNALNVRMDNFYGSIFRGHVIQDFVSRNTDWADGDTYMGYETVLTPSAAVRTTFQLIISRTHIKFWIPALNAKWVDSDIPDLGFTQAVVQFGHHSYNPFKCDPPDICTPNTWHWDNVSINPGVPFTITRATTEYVDPGTPSAVTFPSPSVAGDHLRFAGIGAQYEVSFNGGATWQAAGLQPAAKADPSAAQSYWMPVPTGTQRVDVRAQGGWWGGWRARDFSFWGPVEVAPNRRTPTPTVTVPTRTPTVPPTQTPGPTATLPPTPTSLPTITPTRPTDPTATPTSPPRCGRWDVINGGAVFTPYADSACMQ